MKKQEEDKDQDVFVDSVNGIIDEEDNDLRRLSLSSSSSSPEDGAVMATADEALLAKQAAAQAGYYEDPYIDMFLSSSSSSSSFSPPRRQIQQHQQHRQQQQHRSVQPIIKRGTHARVACIDRAIDSFVAACNKTDNDSIIHAAQIVVLGAGMDTNFLRHTATAGHKKKDSKILLQKWFEVDHASVIQRKKHILQRHASQLNVRIDKTPEGNGFVIVLVQQQQKQHAADSRHDERAKDTIMKDAPTTYCTCLAHDLRLPPSQLLDTLVRHGLDADRPVLFVAECVQMYLPQESSKQLWRAISNKCRRASLVLYDPILQNDAFGRVMEQHLRRAHVATPDSSLLHTRTLRQHLDKLVTESGFAIAVGCDMWDAYHTVLTMEQRLQANQAEFLDELEEWKLLMEHYCLVVACNNNRADGRLAETGHSSPMGFVESKCQVVVRQHFASRDDES